jgi:hypothetical protein
VEAKGGNREEATSKFREMQESYEVLSSENAKSTYDALWEGQHSTLAKEERGGTGVEPKEKAAHRHAADNFARGLLAARMKQEKAAREQREQAAQRQAARVNEEEARAQQAAALEREEKNRKEQYKAREQRAVRERAEREEAAKGREERGKSVLLRVLAHRAPGARQQGPFAEHFACEQRELAEREQAARVKEAREKELRVEQAVKGRWASHEQGVWERTDQTRGRAALRWARIQASLGTYVRGETEHARWRDAREPRERACVPGAPEIFLRELQGQLRRSWTDVGSRRVLKPLAPKLSSRKSSI